MNSGCVQLKCSPFPYHHHHQYDGGGGSGGGGGDDDDGDVSFIWFGAIFMFH